MPTFQSIAEDVLLGTGASRVMLQLMDHDGRLISAAEAVSHGARQIRNDVPTAEAPEIAKFDQVPGQDLLVQEDTEQAPPQPAWAAFDLYGARARVLAVLVAEGKSRGVLSVHHMPGPRPWGEQDIEAIRNGRHATLALLDERTRKPLAALAEELRDAAIQAVLDGLRVGLRVQRCTLRQNVSQTWAFPVTHESRGDGVWSLLGDLTIEQSGQPVIKKMLAEGVQVVQDDTRGATDEPVFHTMLQHYGDMRSQIVTPMFCDGAMAAVLSIHSLRELRSWSIEETALARSANQIIGLLIGIPTSTKS